MLLSTCHAARILGVCEATVRIWANTGRLPAQRLVNGQHIYDLADVERLAAERRSRSQA